MSRSPLDASLSLFRLQLLVGLAITTFAIGWTWSLDASWQVRVEAPRAALRTVHESLLAASDLPEVPSGDLAELDRWTRERAEAWGEVSAAIDTLHYTAPWLDDQVDALHILARDLAETTGRMATAAPPVQGRLEDRVESLTDALHGRLDGIQAQIDGGPATHRAWLLGGGLALWLIAAATQLALFSKAQRRYRSSEQEERTALATSIASGAAIARAVQAGEARPAPVPHPLLEELLRTVVELADAFTAARRELARVVRLSGFRHELGDALALAETEEDVARTVLRAASIAVPEGRVRLLRFGEGGAEGQPAGDQVCDPRDERGCPAVRAGRLVKSTREAPLSRCPRLSGDVPCASCVPVLVDGRASGVVQLVAESPDEVTLQVLQSMASVLGERLGVVRALEGHQLQAATDPLTGLFNRRPLTERLAALDARRVSYAVLALDLDHFKRINDTYGHDGGDRCLKIVADTLRAVSRKEDVAARVGGEEFVVVVTESGLQDALDVAERLRAAVAAASSGAGCPFTVSVGVARVPAEARDGEDALRRADEALYAAKAAGRDTVVVAGAPRVMLAC